MVAKKNGKSKKKLTSSEIMERVIDVEELEKRKQNLVKEEPVSKEETVIEKEKQWWQLPMKKALFKTKKHEGKFYGQYEGWKECIWIGPYDTEKRLNDVIKSYVEETKKPVMDRNIKNVHSILLNIKE
jgi:hypothetical protein